MSGNEFITSRFKRQKTQRKYRYLLYKYRKPHLKQTTLEEVAKSGIIRLYAPSLLEAEMLSSTIPQVSQKYKIPQETLFSSWETYKAILILDARFDYPKEVNSSCLPPKDAPYVQLQNAISALGIFSNDRDIDALGRTRLDRELVMTTRGQPTIRFRSRLGVLLFPT